MNALKCDVGFYYKNISVQRRCRYTLHKAKGMRLSDPLILRTLVLRSILPQERNKGQSNPQLFHLFSPSSYPPFFSMCAMHSLVTRSPPECIFPLHSYANMSSISNAACQKGRHALNPHQRQIESPSLRIRLHRLHHLRQPSESHHHLLASPLLHPAACHRV